MLMMHTNYYAYVVLDCDVVPDQGGKEGIGSYPGLLTRVIVLIMAARESAFEFVGIEAIEGKSRS